MKDSDISIEARKNLPEEGEDGEERGVRGNICIPLAGGSSGRLGQGVQRA